MFSRIDFCVQKEPVSSHTICDGCQLFGGRNLFANTAMIDIENT